MIVRSTLSRGVLLCLFLTVFGRVAAQDSDLVRLLELVRERNVIVVVDKQAPPGIRDAATKLAEAAGQPLVEDVCFINPDGDRKWAFSVHNAGHEMLAVGTPADNSVIRELFYTNARKRPDPLLANELSGVARLKYFHAGRLEAQPWSGAPFAMLAASSATSVVDTAETLVRQFASAAVERPALSAWFEPLSSMTFPQAVNRESERLSLELSAARNERIWVKFVVRSEIDVDQLDIRVSKADAIQGLMTPVLYHLERRRGCGTRYDDIMVPLRRTSDGTVRLHQPPTKEAICFLLECQTPQTVAPGQYRFDVTCRAGDLTPVTLPVRLTLLDFALPDAMPIPVYFYCSPHNMALREFFATEAEAEAEYEHALHSLGATFRKFWCTVCPGISYNGMVRWVMKDDGRFRIDYGPMEQFIDVMRQEGLGGPYIVNGRLKYPRRTRLFMSYGRAEIYDEQGTHYDLRNDRGGSGPFLSRDWKATIKQTAWLEDLREHLERTGRLGSTYFYSGDEPSDFDDWLEKANPILNAGLTPITSINRTMPVENLQKLVGTLDTWILLYHPWRDERWNNVPRHELWQDFARQRRKADDDVWWCH